MTISARRVDTMCDDDATMTKRWAPFSPPDDFDVADATCPVSWALATRGGRGGAPGGRVEGVVGTLLIVDLGSDAMIASKILVPGSNPENRQLVFFDGRRTENG